MTDQYFKIAFNKKSIFAKEKGLQTHIPVDIKLIKRILKSGWDKEYRKCDENWLKMNNLSKSLTAKKHLILIKEKIRGKILCSVLGMNQIGRAYYEKAIALSSLPRELRQALQIKPIIIKNDDGDDELNFQTTLYDYDLANAQFSILLNILNKSNVPKNEYKAIRGYCKNRDKWLKLIKDRYFEGDKSLAKLLVIKLLNLGNLDYSLDMIGVNVDAERDNATYDRLKLLRKEMYNITHKYVIPNNKELYKEILEKKGGDKNLIAKKKAMCSIISRFLQFYEQQIIEGVLVELIKQKIIKKNCFDYAFDGFLVPQQIPLETLKKITTDLGWDLNWTLKGADEGENLWFDVVSNEDVELEVIHPEEYLKKFDIEYFKNDLYGQYALQKEYFEIFYTLVLNPEPMFMFSRLKAYKCRKTNKIKYRRVITPVKFPDVRRSYQDVYGRIITKKNGDDDEIPFIVDYMKDRFKNCKVEIEFNPSCSPNSKPAVKNNYNMFQGYNPICFEKGIKFDPKSIEKGGILYDYLIVVENVCGGKKEAKVFNAHMAHKILYPHHKPRTAICIISTEGVGKNVILTTNSQIFGEFHYISTTNLSDIIGTHAEGLPSKLVVNLNEINFADSSKKKDALKGIVSEDRMRVNAKNIRPYDVDVYALIIATSNNNCCLCIDTKNGDRRWIVLESNEVNKFLEKMEMPNGKNKWDYLINQVWSSKKFIQQLYLYYQWLDRYDEIKNYDFTGVQREMSNTDAYFRLAQYCIPMTTLFLSNYIMNCRCLSGVNYLEDDSVDNYYNYDSFYKEFQIKLTELHKIYDEWYIDKRPNGLHLKGIQQFKNELDGFRFKSTSFSKKKNAVYITFKPCYLLKELDSRKFVNVDFDKWDKQKMMGKEKVELVNPFDNEIIDF